MLQTIGFTILQFLIFLNIKGFVSLDFSPTLISPSVIPVPDASSTIKQKNAPRLRSVVLRRVDKKDATHSLFF